MGKSSAAATELPVHRRNAAGRCRAGMQEPGCSDTRIPIGPSLKKAEATGVSVPVVARRHSINANQLFIWRGQHRRGELIARSDGDHPARLLPVEIQPLPEEAELGARDGSEPEPVGCMEIRFSGGQRGRWRAKCRTSLARMTSPWMARVSAMLSQPWMTAVRVSSSLARAGS
jgi:transposase-like protein